jgi:hypothetical protein
MPFTATVRDAGGGEVVLVVDRWINLYPEPGQVVVVSLLGGAAHASETDIQWWGPLSWDEYQRRRAETS